MYDTKFFIRLIEIAFKMMKNGVYFIVKALLFAELFKMTCDVTLWTQNDVKSQKMEYLLRLFLYRTETLSSCCTDHKVS